VGIKHRAFLDALPLYESGRTPADVVRAQELAGTAGPPEIAKLSSNESPYPPPAAVYAAVTEACAAGNRYPDFNNVSIVEAIAGRYDVDPARVTVGNGSVSLVRDLCLITSGPSDEVVYAVPSFPAYGRSAQLAGATGVPVPLADETHDLDAMLKAATPQTSLVFVCNPNNPTGTTVGGAALEDFIRAVPQDVLVVLDEAYHEYVTDEETPDGLDFVRKYDNVAVIRTFSKAYSLAGFRVGYAISSVDVAGMIKKIETSYAVSLPAQAAAVASLDPQVESELLARVATIVRERNRVADALEAMGVRVVPSQANFLYLPVGGRAVEVATEFENRGVILRPIGQAGVRVTIGLPVENERFLAVARELLDGLRCPRA